MFEKIKETFAFLYFLFTSALREEESDKWHE